MVTIQPPAAPATISTPATIARRRKSLVLLSAGASILRLRPAIRSLYAVRRPPGSRPRRPVTGRKRGALADAPADKRRSDWGSALFLGPINLVAATAIVLADIAERFLERRDVFYRRARRLGVGAELLEPRFEVRHVFPHLGCRAELVRRRTRLVLGARREQVRHLCCCILERGKSLLNGGQIEGLVTLGHVANDLGRSTVVLHQLFAFLDDILLRHGHADAEHDGYGRSGGKHGPDHAIVSPCSNSDCKT